MAFRIHGTVLPAGEVREVFIADGRFTFHGVDDAETLLEDGILLPGLVDVHAHLGLASPAGDDSLQAQVEASERAHLDAGVLLIRDPGGPGGEFAGGGPDRGLPRVVTAGRFLAPPNRYFPGMAREIEEDALPDAAAEECAASGGWAKVIGDSPFPGPGLSRTFRAETLIEAADRVHARGGRIAIHCATADVIGDAIAAGFDSLEHGTAFAADHATAAAAKGLTLVPTRTIDPILRAMARDMSWPDAAIRALDDDLDRQPDGLLAAHDAGVTILAGTDAGMGPHGMVRHEVRLLIDGGLPPSVALGGASWSARTFLGFPGIEEGAPADLVAFRDDPRDDPSILASPDVVILNGAPRT